MGLKVILPLTAEQRTKLLARTGKFEEQLVLDVADDVTKDLDPEHVLVDSVGRLIILDRIEEDGLIVRLSRMGWGTKITEQLVDYIIENNKQVFDADVLRKLYVLQDEVLTERKNKIMQEQMEIARREEAKQILKDLIQKYEDEIKGLEHRIRNLNDEIEKLENKRMTLHEKLKDFAEFIKEKGLTNDFVEFIRKKRSESEISQIKEEYELEEDC
jgi:uncharacterized lipoprotein YehR (DUF1307 family)